MEDCVRLPDDSRSGGTSTRPLVSWGLRHYEKVDAKFDPTSPLGGWAGSR